MKIAPLSVRDPWYGRMLNNRKVHADALKAVPVETVVEMELVELLHGGPESNYRPYLHLRGELTSVVPSVELPYGVTELPLPRGGETIDAFYDFNASQLVDLVAKGYFTEAFEVPDAMTGIPWTLPGAADFLVVAPELETDAPVVFMNVHHQHSLELDEANSGYELADYFPDYTATAAELEQGAESEELQRSESTLDMFSDVQFVEHVPAIELDENQQAEEQGRREVPDGVFSRLVAEIESKRTTEEPAIEAPTDTPEAVSGWDFYMSRVAPGVDRVLAGEHLDAEDVEVTAETIVEEVTVDSSGMEAQADEVGIDSDGFLTFSDEVDEELTPLSERDDHQQAAARRAARLRAELAAGEEPLSGDEAQHTL